MSFSAAAKNELARFREDGQCCQLAEFSGMLETNSELLRNPAGRDAVKFSSENASVSRKLFKLGKGLLEHRPEILVAKKSSLKKNNLYSVIIPLDSRNKPVLKDLDLRGLENGDLEETADLGACCRRAYLRGAFLGGGSIINPNRTYHLEITAATERQASRLADNMRRLGLKPGTSRRKQWFVVYLKEAEQIAHFLNLIGAHTALLNWESVRVYKGMRNRVNRLVNCETANINKTVNAGLRQIENIGVIQGTMGLSRLPENLGRMAQLRLDNPEASLKELGEMMDPKISKSAANHRMRRIEQIADRIRERKSRGEG